MKGVIYYGNVIPASKASDGETPTAVIVTEEVNGYAVWHTSAEEGEQLVKFYPSRFSGRDEAIEHGVALAQRGRKQVAA